MPYKISISSEDKYARFELSGRLSQSEIDNAIEELRVIRQDQGIGKVLCNELDLEVPPNDTIGFLTAERLSSGPFVGLKLAIVRTDTTKERLFEIAANNRSAIVKVFDDESEATHWLHNI